MNRLPAAFWARDTVEVARAAIGQRLVRMLPDGRRLSGLVTETEAYRGPDDQASHAYRLTRRSAIMYGPPGHAYVYVIYGRNHCLNVVTEAAGMPGAILIRGLAPQEGIDVIRARRGRPADLGPPGLPPSGRSLQGLTDGPGKLCQALDINLALNGADLATSEALFFEAGPAAPEADVSTTPRVGVRGDEATRARLWRFLWRRTA